MTPTHVVKDGFSISIDGIEYGGGEKVCLTSEQAEGPCKPYVDPIPGMVTAPAIVLEDLATEKKGADRKS